MKVGRYASLTSMAFVLLLCTILFSASLVSGEFYDNLNINQARAQYGTQAQRRNNGPAFSLRNNLKSLNDNYSVRKGIDEDGPNRYISAHGFTQDMSDHGMYYISGNRTTRRAPVYPTHESRFSRAPRVVHEPIHRPIVPPVPLERIADVIEPVPVPGAEVVVVDLPPTLAPPSIESKVLEEFAKVEKNITSAFNETEIPAVPLNTTKIILPPPVELPAVTVVPPPTAAVVVPAHIAGRPPQARGDEEEVGPTQFLEATTEEKKYTGVFPWWLLPLIALGFLLIGKS